MYLLGKKMHTSAVANIKLEERCFRNHANKLNQSQNESFVKLEKMLTLQISFPGDFGCNEFCF